MGGKVGGVTTHLARAHAVRAGRQREGCRARSSDPSCEQMQVDRRHRDIRARRLAEQGHQPIHRADCIIEIAHLPRLDPAGPRHRP